MNEEIASNRPGVEELPMVQRLAFSYAPAKARGKTLGLLMLDAHLAVLLRQMREPVLTQMRLAWWRDTLGKPASKWPQGNNVLAQLTQWSDPTALIDVVDGWEQLVADHLGAAEIGAFASGRAKGFAVLADELGTADAAAALQAGQIYAMADLLGNVSDPNERALVQATAAEYLNQRPHLGRALRPLTVLSGLARKVFERGGGALIEGPGGFAHAVRLGLIGR